MGVYNVLMHSLIDKLTINTFVLSVSVPPYLLLFIIAMIEAVRLLAQVRVTEH